MTTPTHTHDALNDIRLAVRDACKKYDGAYWRALDKDGAYPEAQGVAACMAAWYK